MIGTSISHDRIIARLGEGRRGEVFRARDAAPGRTVGAGARSRDGKAP